MSIRKILLMTVLVSTIMFSQSVFNAYGLGLSRTSFHTSVNGAGSIGLVPTFHPGVSMDNPATWPGLKFTYVSGSFSNQAHGLNNAGVTNQSAGFNNIQFVVPIKERFGFGISLKPLNSHNAFFSTDTVSMDFEGETLRSNKEFRSGGGIMSGSFGIALPLNQHMGIGLSYNALFGSSRDEHSMVLNDTYYRLFNVRTYSGSTFSVDFAGRLFKNDKMMLLTFARVSMTNKPVSGSLYQFDLFEDTNNNYSFDTGDYPSEVDVDTIDVTNIYAPNSFSFGINANFKNDFNIFGEFELWNDEATNMSFASIHRDQIGSKTHVGSGLVRFGRMGARNWQDRLTFRLGLHRDIYQFIYSGKSLIENGISVGFGFKFAATGNQIDFSFRNGSRIFDETQKEIFREVTVGVSLGDIWFLRRRGKQ